VQARIRRGLRPISAAYASCIALYRRGACAGVRVTLPFPLVARLGWRPCPALSDCVVFCELAEALMQSCARQDHQKDNSRLLEADRLDAPVPKWVSF
jgi:hypothetical protein